MKSSPNGVFRRFVRKLPYLNSLFAERDALQSANRKLTDALFETQNKLAVSEKSLSEYEALPELSELKEQLETSSTELEAYKTWQPPGHFYSPIPDVAALKAMEEQTFATPQFIRGLDIRDTAQFEFLQKLAAFYADQPFTAQRQSGRRYQFANPNFSYGDAIFLYCMMRQLRPRRLIEIGSGYSSCAMLDTNDRDFNGSIKCTFIEPYPQLLYDLLLKDDLDRINVIDEPVQHVDLRIFQDLSENDILFIDSSHVLKTGSDVRHIVCEILPILNPGVYIHFHDIVYPFEYPMEWVYEGRAWNEAYFLRAFLMYNPSFQIELFSSYVIDRHRDFVSSQMPLCLKNQTGSLWIKKTMQTAGLERPDDIPRFQNFLKATVDLAMRDADRQLGFGWYEPEGDHRWMGRRALVRLAVPSDARGRLSIRAFNPHSEPRVLTIFVGRRQVGQCDAPSGSLTAAFDVPKESMTADKIVVAFEVDHTSHVPGDRRELGLCFGSVELA